MRTRYFQAVTQIVGLLTLFALALYGLFSLMSGTAVFAEAAERLGIATNPTIPATFNYEGVLREDTGILSNGDRDITATIYDAALDGTVLYTESFPGTNVRDGQFSIVLGDDPQGQSLFDVFETAPLYMGIQIGTADELIPRERIHGVPWAIYSENSRTAFNGIPIGGIVDWWEPTGESMPSGFLECNGQIVNDTRSPINGQAVPDLRGRFVRGGYPSTTGSTGGTTTHLHSTGYSGQHSHGWIQIEGANPTHTTWNSDGTTREIFDWGDGSDTAGSGFFFLTSSWYDLTHYTSQAGNHNHSVTSSNHLPPYTDMMKLCRIY